jgi:hypothetical protein
MDTVMPGPTLQHLAIHYGLRLDASDAFVQGYVDGMRLDQRGQGVACGRGWIPRSKKCSRDKASQTSKEAKAKTVEKAKARAKLKGEVNAAKGQKARVKDKDTKTSSSNKPPTIEFNEIEKIPPMAEAPIGRIMVLTPNELKWWTDKPKEVEWEMPGVGTAKAKLLKAGSNDLESRRYYRIEAGGQENKVPANDFAKQIAESGIDMKNKWFQSSDFVRK